MMYRVSAVPLGKLIGRSLSGVMIDVPGELPKAVVPIVRWDVIEMAKVPVFAFYSHYDMALAKLAYEQSIITEGEYLALFHANKSGTLNLAEIGQPTLDA